MKTYIIPTIRVVEIDSTKALLSESNLTGQSLDDLDYDNKLEESLSEQWVKRYKGVFGDEEW